MFQRSILCNIQGQDNLTLPDQATQRRMESFRKLLPDLIVCSGIRVNAISQMLDYLRKLGFEEHCRNTLDKNSQHFIYTVIGPHDDIVRIKESLYSHTSHITFETAIRSALLKQMKTSPAPLFFIWAYNEVPWTVPFMNISTTEGLCPSCFSMRPIDRAVCADCTRILEETTPAAYHKLYLIKECLAPHVDELNVILAFIVRLW